MQTLPLSSEALELQKALADNSAKKGRTTGETVHVDGVGASLYFAYEQLRNAAEYSEQHLLMRRSIERFLVRSINLARVTPLAKELVIDLTQSRYIKNDTIARTISKEIDGLLQQFGELYKQSIKIERNRELVRKWVLQTASVHIEQLLGNQTSTGAFANFAAAHYRESIDRTGDDAEIGSRNYEIALYCAVHREILKSDLATTRAYALSSPHLNHSAVDPAHYFVELNSLIDGLYNSKFTNRLVRVIRQHGAPMRIMREIVYTDPMAPELLAKRTELLARAREVTYNQYKLVRQRLNNGIVRSVAFVAVTKMLVGIILEVPYDLVRHGEVVWKPLLINLVFPPLYMATLGLGIRPPSQKNVDLIEDAIDGIVYQNGKVQPKYRLKRRVESGVLNGLFNILYAVTFVVWMGALAWLLYWLGFNLVSGIIFFVFLSTVSFLGFRLTQAAREYEMIEAKRGTLGFIADFFYTPFIRIGYWLSDTYARINVVTRVLDLLIEMPMKFVLRFLQQWVSFLRDKQEGI